jgi:hypothetical protein
VGAANNVIQPIAKRRALADHRVGGNMNESVQTGLVGFFDILGYQNLLERNEPEKIAQDVLPILTNIGSETVKSLKKRFTERGIESDLLDEAVQEMNWLVFSDTVLLTLPVSQTDPVVADLFWLTFLMAVVGLQQKLFDLGLPTRGAIEYGKFFVKATSFAGRTIVSAYQLCCQIELAACVLSEAATKEFHRVQQHISQRTNDTLLNTVVVEYLVPMKDHERHMLVVMAQTYNIHAPDIHRDVMQAFWGNGKDISLSARLKAQNTEQWLEFLEHRLKKK